MIARVKRAWAKSPVLTLLFAVALIGTIGFGVRTAMLAVYWSDPAHRNQTIESWMTPRYVSMSYRLPPEVLGPVLGLDPQRPPRETMDHIAGRLGLTLEQVEARVRATAVEFQASHP